MQSPLVVSENRIEFSNYKFNKVGYSISIALMFMMGITPILFLTLILINGGKPFLGLLFVFGIFGFASYFFYRLATWNKFGKEYFILSDNKLIYQPKAKNISYKTIEFQIENTELSIVKISDAVTYNGAKENLGWLFLNDGETKMKTNIKSPLSILYELTKSLEKWNIKNNSLLDELKEH